MMIRSNPPVSGTTPSNTNSSTTPTNQEQSRSSSTSTVTISSSNRSAFIPNCNPSEITESSTTQISLNQPISAASESELSGVSCVTLSSIGRPQSVSGFKAISGNALTYNGKPEILYIGGEFCPYCAAERWSLIVALSKFGQFSGLEYMMSSSNDIYPNTNTFTFLNATYSSPYVSFVTVEVSDRNRLPLQSLTNDEQAILNEYDSGESIPFVDISNQFVIVTSQYSPSVLSGATWGQIGSDLNNSQSEYAINIDGAANIIIGDICAIDGYSPAVICDRPLPSTQA
jgi:thiol-disulfide isomerase/thioredoxin